MEKKYSKTHYYEKGDFFSTANRIKYVSSRDIFVFFGKTPGEFIRIKYKHTDPYHLCHMIDSDPENIEKFKQLYEVS